MAGIQSGINQLVGIAVGAVKAKQTAEQALANKKEKEAKTVKDAEMAKKARQAAVDKINAIYDQKSMTTELRKSIVGDLLGGVK